MRTALPFLYKLLFVIACFTAGMNMIVSGPQASTDLSSKELSAPFTIPMGEPGPKEGKKEEKKRRSSCGTCSYY
ncbi:hypothetical protein [Bdellovibrio bacteriovorus]|uniref:hypothetical protein n=1 Tax=Bdellovibrio bacteriovorus TaxID=959 RepID=UPI0035A6E252